MKIGRLIARCVIGAAFVGHGTQKWFGWFDGPGIDGAAEMMNQLGLRPGRRNAVAASATETLGGAMIIAGAFTPLAGAGLIGTMVTAIRTVHWKNGFWNANRGYEFNLTLIAALLSLIEAGPGEPSVDTALGVETHGPRWALAALAAGVLGSTVAVELGHRQLPAEPASQAAAGIPEPEPVAS